METSQTIGALAKALSAAQGQFKPIKRESANPFYKSKYADLGAIIEATREALSKNGLAVSQLVSPGTVDGGNEHVNIETVLMHESGEWIKGTISLIPKADDPQSVGSALTYARRYSLSAILGVASEEDDDATAATQPEKPRQVSDPTAPATTPQMTAIQTLLTKAGIMKDFERHEKVTQILGLNEVMTTLKNLTRGQASLVIEALGKEVK